MPHHVTAKVRLFGVLAAILPATIVLTPVQLLAMRFHRPTARALPVFWHRMATRLIGVRVHVRGEPPAGQPLLIVSNHLSWSDIIVLGSVMPLSFIAKREVRKWPGFNMLAWLQRSVFIDRTRRLDSVNQANTIARRMADGDAMVLFAEGTTGDGTRIGPFKSALFGAVHAALDDGNLDSVTVQPVAIAYTRLHGMPLGRMHQSYATWPGDVPLVPHLTTFLLNGAYDVEVVFGETSTFSSAVGRK